MDSEAAASWGGNGYEIFTLDVTGAVDIPIAGEVLEEGDAFLIAAAPDMAEALKWFIDDIDSTETNMAEFDANVAKARAALAKAGLE